MRLNGNNQLGDDACVYIAEGLYSGAPLLKNVHMADTRLGNQAARVFAAVIKKKETHLKDLDLSNNQIVMNDIEILANSYKESQVECLNLRGNIVTCEEIIAFE